MLMGPAERRQLLITAFYLIAACDATTTAATTAAATTDSPPTTSCAGPVAGAVIGTFFATLILIGLIYLLRQRYIKSKKGISKSSVNLTNLESNDGRYAYDNPYFDDSETVEKKRADGSTSVSDIVQRGDEDMVDGGRNTSVESNKMAANSHAAKGGKKGKSAKSNLFNVLTTAKLGRHRALDDSCIHLEPEKLLVPLRGIDFTGLGFNVCGNMRDGIFIKDVLHRGPAMESGKIKAGDRILSLTVSFANMVYEDALTILSYASPYDVQLEIQKMSEAGGTTVVVGNGHSTLGHQKKGSNSSNASGAGYGSVSGRERLYHPLYRSQSIGDLSKIGKDDSSTKRSSSVGGTAVTKVPRKEPYVKTVQSLNEEGVLELEGSKVNTLNVTSAADFMMSSAESLDALDAKPKTSRFRVQKVVENEVVVVNPSQINVEIVEKKTENEAVNSAVVAAATVGVKDGDDISTSSKSSSNNFETVDLNDVANEIPIPAKRNIITNTSAKRKAPPPPPAPFGTRPNDDDDDDFNINVVGAANTLQVSPDIHEVPGWVSTHHHHHPSSQVAIQTNFSSDNESLSSEDEVVVSKINNNDVDKPKIKMMKDLASSAAADRRASSLGDLTSVEESNKKNFPLERSVSMDFNHAELVLGKLAMQQIEQLGAANLNGNGANIVGGSSDDLVRPNQLKTYFGATENLHLDGDGGGTNGHCNFLKSWDQVESLVDVGVSNDDEDEAPPIPKSPIPQLNPRSSKEDEGDLWEVDLSESSSSLSEDVEDEEEVVVEETKMCAPTSKPPPPPPPPPYVKRMIPVDVSRDRDYYDSSSSSSSEEEEDETEQVNRQVINVVDIPYVVENKGESPYIHHDVNTGSSTVTIGAPSAANDNQQSGGGAHVDPEMAKIFNNVTVSNTSRDLFTLDLDSWVQNGGNKKSTNDEFRNGNGSLSPDGGQQYESTLQFDLESPDQVGVISFESTPPPPVPPPSTSASSILKTSNTDLNNAGGAAAANSRTLIITNPSINNNIHIETPPSLQPPK